MKVTIKDVLHIFITFAAIASSLYGIFAFVLNEPNTTLWGWEARYFLATFTLTIWFALMFAYVDKRIMDQP